MWNCIRQDLYLCGFCGCLSNANIHNSATIPVPSIYARPVRENTSIMIGLCWSGGDLQLNLQLCSWFWYGVGFVLFHWWVGFSIKRQFFAIY
jgi:hypothetical protein